MENFKIVYEHWPDDYFNPTKYDEYDFGDTNLEEVNQAETLEETLAKISEWKKVIIRDFEGILRERIEPAKGSDALQVEMKQTIATYDNGIDYSVSNSQNFLIIDDDYICFNNFENHVDELLWGYLGREAETYETIVIVRRDFKEFCFATISTNFVTGAEHTTLKVFNVIGDEVKSSSKKFKGRIKIKDIALPSIKKAVEKKKKRLL